MAFSFFSFLGSSRLKATSADTVGGGRKMALEMGVERELQKWGDEILHL